MQTIADVHDAYVEGDFTKNDVCYYLLQQVTENTAENFAQNLSQYPDLSGFVLAFFATVTAGNFWVMGPMSCISQEQEDAAKKVVALFQR